MWDGGSPMSTWPILISRTICSYQLHYSTEQAPLHLCIHWPWLLLLVLLRLPDFLKPVNRKEKDRLTMCQWWKGMGKGKGTDGRACEWAGTGGWQLYRGAWHIVCQWDLTVLRQLADCCTPLPPPVVNILPLMPARMCICPSLRLPHTPNHALPFLLSSIPPVSLGRRSQQCARVFRCPSICSAEVAITSSPFDKWSPCTAGRILGQRGMLLRGHATNQGAWCEATSGKTDRYCSIYRQSDLFDCEKAFLKHFRCMYCFTC